MWQRRQLKVKQRQRQLNPINSSSASAKDKRDRLLFSQLLVVTCFLATLVALLHGYDGDGRTPRHTSEWALLVRFLRDYPHRFAAFYAPKIQFVVDWSSALYESVEISDDITSALDFTVALVAITPVCHLIEIGQRAMLSRMQPTQGSKLLSFKLLLLQSQSQSLSLLFPFFFFLLPSQLLLLSLPSRFLLELQHPHALAL